MEIMATLELINLSNTKLYTGSKTVINVRNTNVVDIFIHKGFRHVWPMPPALFYIYIDDTVIRNIIIV